MYHIDAPTGNVSLEDARPFLNPNHPLIGEAIPLSMGDSYKGYRIVGTTQEFLGLYDAEIDQGKTWEANFDVTLGAQVAKDLGLKLGDTFNSSHGFLDDEDLAHDDAHAFVVVGVLKPTGAVVDQLILCTTQSFWLVHDHGEGSEGNSPDEDEHDHEGHEHEHEGDTHSHEHDHGDDGHDHEHSDVSHAGHEHDDHDHSQDIPGSLLDEDPEQQITSLLVKFKARNYMALNLQRNINENTDLQAATPAIEINRLFSMMDSGEKALRMLALVIIFVSGLSVFISLYSSLRDRKYELALMRVSGASPGQLFLLIVMEGLLLALVGFAIGIILSHGGMQLFAGELKAQYGYSFSGFEFLKEEWYLLGGALAIGFVAAVLPAVQASRTDIAETLADGS
jgi:putative ABC transport system permease protein